MALFGNKKNKSQEPKLSKEERYLISRGIESLDPSYHDQVQRITGELAGKGMMRFGMSLSGISNEDSTKIDYLSALVEQN